MSESSSSSASGGGIGFFGLLGIVFITLKLTGYIDWSWWYVTMPLWMPAVIVFGILSIVLVVCIIAALCEYKGWL